VSVCSRYVPLFSTIPCELGNGNVCTLDTQLHRPYNSENRSLTYHGNAVYRLRSSYVLFLIRYPICGTSDQRVRNGALPLPRPSVGMFLLGKPQLTCDPTALETAEESFTNLNEPPILLPPHISFFLFPFG
jgi:hypothetical protein